MVDASDARKCDDASIARRFDTARDRCVTVERHVGTVLIVVARMRSDQPQQVAFTEHDDVVEHFAPKRAHPPFRASIQVCRRLRMKRRVQHDVFGLPTRFTRRRVASSRWSSTDATGARTASTSPALTGS